MKKLNHIDEKIKNEKNTPESKKDDENGFYELFFIFLAGAFIVLFVVIVAWLQL